MQALQASIEALKSLPHMRLAYGIAEFPEHVSQDLAGMMGEFHVLLQTPGRIGLVRVTLECHHPLEKTGRFFIGAAESLLSSLQKTIGPLEFLLEALAPAA